MRSLLVKAMAQAPLDFGDVWGVGLRYALHNLSEHNIEGCKAILQLVSTPVAPGAIILHSVKLSVLSCTAYMLG